VALPDPLATARGRRWLFAALYLSEGAPIGYLWWALPTRLRDAGVAVEDVTALSALLTVPWTFKFLWAPLVDGLRSPRVGLTHWIIGAQALMGLALLPLIQLDLVDAYPLVIACLLVHAVCAATQDVAIDALAVRSIPVTERGSATGWMQVGMLGGRALFGGVALAVERWVGAGAVIGILVGCVWSTSLLVLLIDEPDRSAPHAAGAAPAALAGRLLRVLRRPETWLGIGFAALAGAGMEAAGALAGPLLIDHGLSKAAVGRFFALPAVAGMALGALLGGRIADAVRREPAAAGAVLAVADAVALVAWATLTAEPWRMVAALTLVYALFGVLTAATYALLMDLTDPLIGGTQFSTYMGAINLCYVWSAAAAGQLAGRFGYPSALLVMAAASLLSLPILRALHGYGRAHRS
jgi:predicted MFS family arabinose efflux permease